MPGYNEWIYSKISEDFEGKLEKLMESQENNEQQKKAIEKAFAEMEDLTIDTKEEPKPMPYRMEPVYYTIKELEVLYKKHKITFKEFELYKHCPNKIPIKTWRVIPEELDTSTKTAETEDNNSTKTI